MTFPRIDRIKTSIFFLVLVFTFILRAHNYDRVPTAAHLDEMLYAWSGIYLVETGEPVSWSTLDYPERAKVFSGTISYKGGIPEASVDLYKPWLDQPPLFALLVGSFAHYFGADRNEFVPSSYIRFPVIFISAFTSIMVFLIAKKTSGYWTGILSMLVYGTVPVMVFASRTALPENLIAFVFTLIIYLILMFRDNPKALYILPIPFLVGIAGLSKPTGYFLLPFAVYFVFAKLYEIKKTKAAIKYLAYLVLLTVPFILAFVAYGYHFDDEIFKRITEIQSSRPTGFGGLGFIWTTPSFSTATVNDSWYVFLLISAGYFLFTLRDKLRSIVLFGFVYWIMVVLVTGGEWDLLAWYRFPAFPALAILGAWGLVEIVKRADFFVSFLGVGLLLGNRRLLVNAFYPNTNAFTHRILFGVLMAPSLVNFILGKKYLLYLSRAVIVGVIIVGMYLNTKYIYSAFDLECQSKTCPIAASTPLSTIHFPVIWRFFVVGD